jgi:hypothetical protein
MTVTIDSTNPRSRRALALLSQASTWTFGTRKADGQRFALIPGSGGHVYYTSELGCSCPDASRRGGGCKHQTAYRLWQVQHGQPSAPAPRQEPQARQCARCGDRVRPESIYAACEDCVLLYGGALFLSEVV